MFTNALQQDKVPLSSLYGALEGLSELGPEVTRIFILPRVNHIGKWFNLIGQLRFFLKYADIFVKFVKFYRFTGCVNFSIKMVQLVEVSQDIPPVYRKFQ